MHCARGNPKNAVRGNYETTTAAVTSLFNLSGLKRICSVVENEEQATKILEAA